jgi:hypothetical protein
MQNEKIFAEIWLYRYLDRAGNGASILDKSAYSEILLSRHP